MYGADSCISDMSIRPTEPIASKLTTLTAAAVRRRGAERSFCQASMLHALCVIV